jgi:hypothetical protein
MSISAITVYDEGFLPNNAFSKIHGLNFVGAGITVEVPAIHFIEDVGIATIRVNFSDIPNDVNIAGILTAFAFVGDGSGLTGVVATGTGVEVQDDGSPVGTAATINFGNNLTVNFSGGVATIDGVLPGISTDSEKLGGEIPSYYLDYDNFTNTPTNLSDFNNDVGFTTFSGDYGDLTNVPENLSDFNNDVGFITSFTDTNYWIQTLAGIHTLGNVGIGTTNPTSALTVSGDVNVSGVVTATSFVGDGSGLTGVVATGTGVEVQDDGSPVGTAVAINFGDNLIVDFSGGVATIDVIGGSESTTGIATDSERLNGEMSSYYLDYDNFTNTPTNLSDFSNDVGFTTFSGDYNDLSNTPTNLSDFNNNVGFTTFTPTGRISIAQTTSVLGIGSTANLTFANGFPEYKLLKASASDGAWITIYTDTQSRTDDENRSIDTDPLPGSGVIAELITTSTGITTQRFTPAVIGYNDDEIISNNIYAKVVNNSGISTEITVTLTIAD